MTKTTQSLVIVLWLSSCIVCSRYGIILKKLDLLKEAVEVFQKSLHQSPLHWGTWLELSTLITDKDMVRGGSQGLRQQGGRAPKQQQGGRTPKPSKITPQDTQNFSKNQKVFYSAYNCGVFPHPLKNIKFLFNPYNCDFFAHQYKAESHRPGIILTPNPSKITPQDTQNILWRIS